MGNSFFYAVLIVVLDGLELVNPRCWTTLVKGYQLRLQIFIGILYVYCMFFSEEIRPVSELVFLNMSILHNLFL